MTNEELVAELDALRSLMIAVATGGPRIDSVNEDYRRRKRDLSSELSERGMRDPIPYGDLWEWYGKWSADFPTYQERRSHITQLIKPLLQELTRARTVRVSAMGSEPTGWERVDRAVEKARFQLDRASDEEDFQQVGMLCREILISLAQAVYNPNVHKTTDGVAPSSTDANRMLEACVQTELPGGTNEAARKHARASLALANDLQHRRTATRRNAALCIEATFSVVNLFAILTDRSEIPAPAPLHSDAETEAQDRVIDNLGALSKEQRLALRSSFRAAGGGSGSLVFAWTVTGGGLDPLEIFLMFLLDNDAITYIREDRSREGEVTRWYRFKPWLFEYLTDHAEVLGDDPDAT